MFRKFFERYRAMKMALEENALLKEKIEELEEGIDEKSENTSFLEDQIKELTEQLIDAEKKLTDPQFHLTHVFKEGFEWFDVDELTRENRLIYGRNADVLLRNPVFKNEINFLTNNLTKLAILGAKDFNDLELKRVIVLAYSDLKTRIESLVIHDKKEEPLDEGEEFEAT